jgi:hypothetical protein
MIEVCLSCASLLLIPIVTISHPVTALEYECYTQALFLGRTVGQFSASTIFIYKGRMYIIFAKKRGIKTIRNIS